MIAYIMAHTLMFTILALAIVLIGLMILAADLPEQTFFAEYPEEDNK